MNPLAGMIWRIAGPPDPLHMRGTASPGLGAHPQTRVFVFAQLRNFPTNVILLIDISFGQTEGDLSAFPPPDLSARHSQQYGSRDSDCTPTELVRSDFREIDQNPCPACSGHRYHRLDPEQEH